MKPYQPEGIWEAVAMPQSNTRTYRQDNGEALYRRSLYTFWKRTAAPPSMEIFNAPSRETFCVTPRPHQHAAAGARRCSTTRSSSKPPASWPNALKSETSDFDARLDFITRRLGGRASLMRTSGRSLRSSLDSALAAYRKPTGGRQQAHHHRRNAAAARMPIAPELAAWTLVASQILNLDETLTR